MSGTPRKYPNRPDCTCGMDRGPGRSAPIDHPLHCAFRRGISEPSSAPTGGAEPESPKVGQPATLARIEAAHAEAHETAKRARQLAGGDGNAFRVNVALEQVAAELEAIADEALRIACEANGHDLEHPMGSACVCGENHL